MSSILFVILILTNYILSGVLFSKKLNISNNVCSDITVGFVFQIAIIEILGWWMITFKMPMILFMSLVLLECIVTSVLGIITLIRSEKQENKLNYTYIILVIFVALLCVFLFLFYRSDADDSFYVSNVKLFSESSVINPYDSSFGNKNLGTLPMYDYQIWESYLAVFCKLFGIKPTIMCHFIMVFVLLLISVSSYSYLGEVLFKEDSKKKNIFATILLLFYSMGGYAVYSKGSFLLSRIWQGKAVYLHIVLPFAIATMLRYVDDCKEQKCKWFLPMIAMFAGVGLNPTSMYVLGFQILFMMMAVAITNKNVKDALCIIPSIGVVGFYSALLYISASKNTGQIEAASSVGKGFVIDVFKTFFGNGLMYFVLYLLCVVLIFKFGEIKGKILCIYTPLLMFVGIWNPVMGPWIAENLTMTPSFWRVFWLIPIDFAIAYCVVIFLETRRKAIVSIALLCSVIIFGQFMFTEKNGFVRTENIERVPPATLVFGEKISSYGDGQVVLANDMASTTLRQEYNEIELIVSRPGYVLDLFRYRGDFVENDERFVLYWFVNNDSDFDAIYVSNLLNKYHVKWIIIDDRKDVQIEFLLNNGYKVKEICQNNVLFEAK